MLNRLKDVFASFHKHEVRYIVIGGIASVLYGVPRATFDLDIFIDATHENTKRLLDALIEASKKAAGRAVDLDDVRLLELPTKKDDV